MATACAVARLVRAQGGEQGDRVHPCAVDAIRVAELCHDLRRAVRARLENADPRHRREVADRRRHRHVLEQRLPDLGRGQVLADQRLAREAILAHERGRLVRRLRGLGAGEALHQRREAVRAVTADDPLEQARVLVRDLQRRVARAHRATRVRQAEQVAVRHALALAVLHRLVRERSDVLRGVPAADCPSERAAPAAEALDELGELEQVRARARDTRERVERRPARPLVAQAGRHRQGEERRIVLGRAAFVADGDDLGDRSLAVGRDALLDRLGVLASQLRLARVVAAALRAEDEEATQTRPLVDGPGEAARAVRNLVGAGNRAPLRHASRAVLLQVRHRTSFRRLARRRSRSA